MTDNELIAVWLGWAGPLDFFTNLYPWIEPNDNPRLEGKQHWHPPSFDTDITLWHGPDGLLAEIEKRGKTVEFGDAFVDESDWPPLSGAGEGLNLWGGLTATPAQLTAALVKLIKEASHGDPSTS